MPSTEWRDGRGRSRWQPTLEDGDRWWIYVGEPYWLDIMPGGYAAPVLYRSRRKAERVARKEQHRRDKWRLDQITEVKQ